jgi:hypothetical protein
MLYLHGEKVCICGFAKVLSPQTSLCLQTASLQITNPQSVTLTINNKCNKFADLPVCK